jgi:hypothetical protein
LLFIAWSKASTRCLPCSRWNEVPFLQNNRVRFCFYKF